VPFTKNCTLETTPTVVVALAVTLMGVLTSAVRRCRDS